MSKKRVLLLVLAAAVMLCGLCSCEGDGEETQGSGTASQYDNPYENFGQTGSGESFTYESDVFSIGGEWNIGSLNNE